MRVEAGGRPFFLIFFPLGLNSETGSPRIEMKSDREAGGGVSISSGEEEFIGAGTTGRRIECQNVGVVRLLLLTSFGNFGGSGDMWSPSSGNEVNTLYRIRPSDVPNLRVSASLEIPPEYWRSNLDILTCCSTTASFSSVRCVYPHKATVNAIHRFSKRDPSRTSMSKIRA